MLRGYRGIVSGDRTVNGARTSAAMLARFAEFLDAQPMLARCVLCPAWQFAGTAAECRDQARVHRETVHPEIKPTKRARYGKTRACKVGLCEQPSAVKMGRYAGLCAQHRNELKEANATGRSRKRGAELGAPGKRANLITPARVDTAWTLHKAGLAMRQIAHLAAPIWGYTNEIACATALRRAMKEAGHPISQQRGPSREIPEVSKSEAQALIEEVA